MMHTPRDQGRLRRRLRDGECVYGTFIGLGVATSAEVAASAGLDLVLLDLEHGAGGEEQIGPTVLAAAAYGAGTVVRVETDERIRIGRALDAGASGIMLPRQESAEQVEASIRHLSIPPHGDRGVAGYTRAGRWGQDGDALRRAAEETLGVVQIETLGALADADRIAAMDGVDVLFVGPSDLSWALGVPGRLDSPPFQDALATVLAAATAHGKAAGILAATPEAARRYRDQGFRFLLIGSDGSLLAGSLRSALEQLAPTTPDTTHP
ncbi:MAG TPA: 2,4-dihydroxyhept-2-ene-1,7-dioic acid aldolase [Candidatus Brachybacterium merdigallinarum]|nr:2,4-dihydroxyhept-2-ene-1,7-dioic acid aldolase [Candidatus Brachybacterium merdigallinarum]